MTIFTQSRLLSKVLSIFSLLMLLTSNLMAQFCLGLNVRPDEANPDEIFLDLTTEEFIGVVAMQFSIDYDPNVVEPISVVTSNLEGFTDGHVNFQPSSMMSLAWFDATTSGVTYSDAAPLIVFKFRRIKEGDPAFDFSEHPTMLEVVLCPNGGTDCDVLDNFINCNTGENLIPSISGKLYLDENKNCELEENESINTLSSWRGWKIAAAQDGAYKFTGISEDGSYSLKIFLEKI